MPVSRYLSASRKLRGCGLTRRFCRYHHCADGVPFFARRILRGQLPQWGRGSLMALFDRKTKGSRAASGAVRVPPTASRHDGHTAGRGARRRVTSAPPASPAVRGAAPAGRGPAASSFETGSYGAVDARDAEAQIYVRRRREEARRGMLKTIAIVAVAVVVLLVMLFAMGVLG